jgi:hypothetical protein
MAKPKIVSLMVANGALLQAPIFETHLRGTNWMAVIDVDATSPGGLSRRFMNRGRGECLYDIEQVGLFDAIEFGADYTTSVGRRNRIRWWGVVVGKTDGQLILEESKTGALAVVRAKEARTSREDRSRALKAEYDAAVEKAARLQRELDELARPEAQSPVESPDPTPTA